MIYIGIAIGVSAAFLICLITLASITYSISKDRKEILDYWKNADKLAKIRNEALLGIWVALDNMDIKKQ